MKKTIAIALAGAIALLALLFSAGSASATGGGTPSPDNNKKVTLCHATSSETNPYVKITVSVHAFYNAGHIDHEGDIYPGFTWTDNKGVEHVVPAQGDQSLLAFEDCVKPVEDEEVVKPEATYADVCGTKDDVFSVAPGRGYTVGPVVVNGATQSITVTLAEGFVWSDKSTDAITITKPAFTNEPCDLPETGGTTTNVLLGLGILALIGVVGGLVFMSTRRTTTEV